MTEPADELEAHLRRAEEAERKVHTCLRKIRSGNLSFESMRDLDAAIDDLITARSEPIKETAKKERSRVDSG